MQDKASTDRRFPRILYPFLILLIFSSILNVLFPSLTFAADIGGSVERDIGSEVQGFQKGIRPFPEPQPAAPQIEVAEEAPEEAGPPQKSFLVREVKLEGVKHIPDKEFEPLLEKYANQNVTMSQLQGVAKRITQFYRQKGFVTSMAYVPPQKIDKKDPLVIIKVVEGKLGYTEITGNRHFSGPWILSYMSQKPGDVIDYNRLQK